VKANARTHQTLRARPVDRLEEEFGVMRPQPDRPPDTDSLHLFRAMKAPAAARALNTLAERVRQEEWSYERGSSPTRPLRSSTSP